MTDHKEFLIQSEDSVAFICPICKSNNAFVNQRILNIPHYQDLHGIIFICPDCGMKKIDFENLQTKEPTKYTYQIENSKDIETKVIRSHQGTVVIENLGIEIIPGASPDSWIRNIEGVLSDIEEKVNLAIRSSVDKEVLDKGKELIKKIEIMKKGEINFRISVSDPSGNSIIIPADKEKLEVSKLETIDGEEYT